MRREYYKWNKHNSDLSYTFGRTTFWLLFFFFEWLAKFRATGWGVDWASWGLCWI